MTRGSPEGNRSSRTPNTPLERLRRRLTQSRLREARLEKILACSLDAAYLRDLRANRYDYVSPVIRDLTGFSSEEFAAFTLADAFARIHPDDLPAVKARLEQAQPAARTVVEYRFRRKDGEYRWLSDYFTVIADGRGRPRCLLGGVRDITGLKRVEDELREVRDDLELRVRERTVELRAEVDERKRGEELLIAERKLAMDLAATSDLEHALALCLDTALLVSGMDFGGVYLVDGHSGRLHLVVHRHLSETFRAAVADYGPDSPNARLVAACRPVYGACKEMDLPPLEDLAALAVLPICDEGRPIACLNLGSRSFKELPRPVTTALEAMAAQVGAALIRIQAEEDRARLAAAVEYATEAVIITDPSWVITYVNPAFIRFTGYTAAEATGRELGFLRSDLEDPQMYARARQAAAQGAPVRTQYVVKGKDGKTLQVESVTYPVAGDPAGIGSFVLVWHDIAEQLRLDEQIRQAQKMQALGTLSGGIAHDFNNILAIILGNAELALDDVSDHDRVRRGLKQIVGASRRARDLIRQILTFSRKTEQQIRPIGLIPLLEETCDMLRSSLPSSIHMVVDLGTGEDRVLADPAQVQQVVMNLASNASQAMQESGGRLTVRLAPFIATEENLPEKGMGPGRYACLTVEDTGIGMAPELLEHVFEPFFTTKEPGQGTGMGLSVVYGIVKSHGGAITVRSRPGEGSTFAVYLPLTRETPDRAWDEAARPPTGQERVLLVDDEAPLTETMGAMLARLGYRVTAMTDPSKAWKAFREDPSAFDLVITDQAMPGMTGLRLAGKMIDLRPDIPVIVCTGFNDAVLGDTVRKEGIRAFVTKPVTRRELALAVRRVLDGKGRAGASGLSPVAPPS